MVRGRRLHLESSNLESIIRRIATATIQTNLLLYPSTMAYSGRHFKFHVAKIGPWMDNGIIGYHTPSPDRPAGRSTGLISTSTIRQGALDKNTYMTATTGRHGVP
jgi:hypothetical protein